MAQRSYAKRRYSYRRPRFRRFRRFARRNWSSFRPRKKGNNLLLLGGLGLLGFLFWDKIKGLLGNFIPAFK